MKKTIFSVFAVMVVTLMTNAQVFTEHFNYTTGSALTSNGWIAHSAAGTNPILVGATSLTFPQYAPTAIGGSAVSAGNSEDISAYFGPIKSGSIYASFLLRVDTIGGPGYFFHFMDSLSTSAYRARTYFQVDANNSNAFNLGITFNSSTGAFDTTEFAFGSTILVVVKYTIISGIDNDEISLYAFDASGSFATEPTTPLFGPFTGTATDIDPARIALRQFNSGNDFVVDAFSVNTVWNMSPFASLAQIDLPITWDDGANVDYTTIDFGGNTSTVVVDPTNSGNMVLQSVKSNTAATWAGTTLSDTSGLATAIPFTSGSTTISVAIWSPDAGIPVRLKAEDHTDNTKSVETEAMTAVANAWDTLVFDFANQATGTAAINFAYTYDMLSIFYNFGTDGATAGTKTYYCDDVFFGGNNSGTISQIDLPITWDDSTNFDYTTTDFGGNTSDVIPSPTNSSNAVLRSVKGAGAQVWAGTTLSTPSGLATAIPFSAGNTEIKVAVWAPVSGTVVRLKTENHLNSAVSVETEATTTVGAAWDTLSFDFANQATGTAAINFANTYDMLSIFYDFGTGGGATATTYYCDNVWFTGVSGPPPSNNSPYCNTQAFHFGIPAEVASSIFLTIKNASSSSMEVIIESATSDPVDDLIIAGSASGGAISAIDTPATGQLRRIISWAGATPPTVDFNVLWSKATFGGNWQLLPSGNLSIPFAATCPIVIPTKAIIDLPITWDDTANVDYTVTDFGGNASTLVVDPTNASNMVLQSVKGASAATWAGTTLGVDSTGLATAIPFSPGNTIMKVAVWSPDANIPIRLKVEDKTAASISVETEATVANASVWDTLEFDFSNQVTGTAAINFANTYDKVSIFYNFGTDGATAGSKTYYCDDVWFMAATPPPSLAIIDLPITWDDTANVDYTVTDFGGNASTLVVDPTNSSNMVLQSVKGASAATWAGTTLGVDSTGLATAIPFSAGNTTIKIAVWSPDANIPVRLKVEDKTAPTISVETEATVANASVWDTLEFDFSNQVTGTAAINFANTYDKVSIFYNFGTDGATAGVKTYYCDDVWFVAPAPLAQIDLPITWDDTANVDYTVTDFEGNSSMHVVDPTNPSNMVLMSTKTSGGQLWAGTTLSVDSTGLATAIPFSAGNTLISVAVWSPDANIPVRLKAEDKTDPTKSVETQVMTMVAGAWDTLVFDFANQATGTAAINFTYTYDKLSIFYDFLNPPATPAKSYYCDDIFFGGNSTSPTIKNVTFQVDMNNYVGSFTTPEVNGTFNGWCGNCNAMSDANNDGIWDITVQITADSIEYKFAADNWAIQEMLATSLACVKTTGSNTNRFLVLTGDTTLPAVCWESCTTCSGSPSSANVTFQVDLSTYTGTYTQVNLNGSFNNWCGGCAVMTDANNDSIYEITVAIPANDTSEYKFTLDAWTVDEQLTQGDPCTKTTVDAGGTFTNRFIVPTADTTLIAVCWESCSACSGIGIGEEIWNQPIMVSPNPSTGTFNISGIMKVTTDVEIMITNIQGQLVYRFNGNRSVIDENVTLNNAANGLYMVNVVTEYGVYSQKIIINK